MMRAFSGGSTATITVSAASQRVLVGKRASAAQVRICNLGSATVWIKAGDSSVTAAVTDMPIPPNGFTEIQTFSPGVPGDLYIAAIAAAATGDIAFTLGEGI